MTGTNCWKPAAGRHRQAKQALLAKSRHRRTLVAMAGLAAEVFAATTGCSSAAVGLNATCSDFLKMSPQQQVHLASEWAYPARDGKTDAMSDAVASSDQQELATYCGQPGHGSQVLQDLDQTLVP